MSASAPPAHPAVWRTVGSPLVAPTGTGPLSGRTVAVKDLFAVAGFAVGGGVPALLAERATEARSAPAVAALLDAGAGVRGIAHTDQLAYSVAGRNPHYGTPPNPAVPGALPGGSSSGPATAVALGEADIGLGTDTAGSLRVPASYQGLWGLRTTHGAVRTDGVLPLAPSFDTVGWLTRDLATLRDAARAGLTAGHEVPGSAQPASAELLVAPAALAHTDPGVRAAFTAAVQALRSNGRVVTEVDVGNLADLYEQFRQVQAAEAWHHWGAWARAHPGGVVGDVAERLAQAATVTPEQHRAASAALRRAAEHLQEVLGERVLLLPSTASPAPPATVGAQELQRARVATLTLTSLAGATGRPALSAPLLQTAGGPVGLCLVGPPGSDLPLLTLGGELAAVLRPAELRPTEGTR